MSLHNDLPEAMRLLMSFLKDHEGKEIWFLLAESFIMGTLDRAPNDPRDGFTLTHATRYPPNGEKQKLDQAVLDVSQIIGWGGDPMNFLEVEG
jgi:hypothetical protein